MKMEFHMMMASVNIANDILKEIDFSLEEKELIIECIKTIGKKELQSFQK